MHAMEFPFLVLVRNTVLWTLVHDELILPVCRDPLQCGKDTARVTSTVLK